MNLATRLSMLIVEFDSYRVGDGPVTVPAEVWRQFVSFAKAEIGRRNSAQRESKKALVAYLARREQEAGN